MQNFFAIFPSLTIDPVKKYPPKSEHTVKGHMRQKFKNRKSTKTLEKPTTIPSEDPIEDSKNPSKTPINNKKFSRDLISSNKKND